MNDPITALPRPEAATPLKSVASGNAVSEDDIAVVRRELVHCIRKATSALEELEEPRGPWLYRARDDAAGAKRYLGSALVTLGTNDS